MVHPLPAALSQAAPPSRHLALLTRDSELAARVRAALPASGWSVQVFGALDQARLEPEPQLVALDAAWGANPEETLRQLQALFPLAGRLLLSGSPLPGSGALARDSGPEALGRGIGEALELHLIEENRRLRARLLAAEAGQSPAGRRFEDLFDAIGNPIVVLDAERRVVRANRAYARLAGRPMGELPGQCCHLLLFDAARPCQNCPIERAGDAARSHELNAGGRSFAMSSFRSGELTICLYRETTEERQDVRRAMQTEKLAAIGQLAGGVAHEINNPLGGILAFVQLMLREEHRSAEDLETLREIEQAALRCKRIVGSLLKFSRRQTGGWAVFDANRAADEVATLFQPQLRSRPRAVFRQEFWPVPLPVDGDVNGVEQVLLSLLVNALQALKDGVGNVCLRTRAEGAWVELSVSDDGEGIAPENQRHLFEPTFTTRSPGENSGFGLAIAWSIAESHGGRIEVKSELGRGSTFTLKLPVAGGPATGDAQGNPSGA